MKPLRLAMFAALAPVLAAPASGLAQESDDAREFDPTLEEWQVPWLESRPRDPYVAPDGRSNRGPNHGKRSRKFNQGCTICVCRCYTGPCWTLPRER